MGLVTLGTLEAAVGCSLFSVPCLMVRNHCRKLETSCYHIRVTNEAQLRPVSRVNHFDVLTAEMKLCIVLSTIKAGMRPPGLVDVAMRHSVFPLGSSLILSTLT